MEGESPAKQYSAKVAATPLDRGRLRRELARLGLRRGMTVLVHCSMRNVGWVEGGAETLRDALLDVIGERRGTLVVPAQTAANSESSPEYRAAVAGLDAARLAAHRAAIRGFDPVTSPSEGMGALAESVRVHPRAHRSPHPIASFAAVGEYAADVCAEHPPECLLGPQSPLALLARLDARVLLLGVGFDKCTAFHLGEARALPVWRSYRCKIGDAWVDFKGLAYQDSDFAELGARFEHAHSSDVLRSTVGSATARLFPLALAADFAAKDLPELRFAR
ncbi:MAG TPA: AAC(3) family N-acetyltransferase [Actinospica sp.]|nr:AAC(3) family N-acetyltransferase [Actinospica sp.]